MSTPRQRTKLHFSMYMPYLRSKDSLAAKAGTPYYIGKGTGGRAYAKHGYQI